MWVEINEGEDYWDECQIEQDVGSLRVASRHYAHQRGPNPKPLQIFIKADRNKQQIAWKTDLPGEASTFLFM